MALKVSGRDFALKDCAGAEHEFDHLTRNEKKAWEKPQEGAGL